MKVNIEKRLEKNEKSRGHKRVNKKKNFINLISILLFS